MRLTAVIIGVLMASGAFAQGEELLSSFSVSQGSDRVDVVWTMKAGNLCRGIEVERTTDTVHSEPEVVHRIAGVCGDERTDVTYSYADLDPVPNTTNYYRLILGATPTTYEAVDYTYFGEKGVILAPQPARDQVTVHFKNDFRKPYRFTVYTMNGNELRSIDNITRSQFTVNTNSLPGGIYLYRLKGEDTGITGKLSISR